MTSIKKWVLKNVPQNILAFFFPSKFKNFTPFKERFIEIFDEIANKNFFMYLRRDTWIEHEFLQKGLYGEWEMVSLKLWSQLSKNFQVIVDIGANTGTYALLAQNNNPTAIVIAVEPVNINHEILAKNIVKNNFPIKAEKIALSNKEGVATMYMLKDRLNYMTSVNDDRYKLHPEIQGNTEVVPIQVPIKPFNYLVNKHHLSTVDLVKLDVEGHELAVLHSMENIIKAHHPAILIEVIGDENANKLDEYFREIGYDTYLAVDEKKGLLIVDKLWDNNHANFLVCQKNVLNLIPKNLFA